MDRPDPRHPRTDGRLQRSARTKKALIEAYLDLLREKPQAPTGVPAEKSIHTVVDRRIG